MSSPADGKLPGVHHPNVASVSRRTLIASGGALLAVAAVREVLQRGSSSAQPGSAGTETSSTTRAALTRPTEITGSETAALEAVGRPDGRGVGFDPDALYVALYGHPGSMRLGALGEQPPAEAAIRLRDVARPYEAFGRPVVPTFEIIATVAAADAGADGNYSNESPASFFQPWLDVARDNGFHVVLDLQPGQATFPEQIRLHESLLAQPHVSVALDPEWRVEAPGRPVAGAIGTVSGAEVNEAVAELDSIVRRNDLPRKMLIVHQFTESMITDKQTIRGTDNVQIVIHMDGFGSLDLKRNSYQKVTSDLPAGALPGWKNFYDEDRPTPTPAETLDVLPVPMFVSYQ
jgi:hypothetical protein